MLIHILDEWGCGLDTGSLIGKTGIVDVVKPLKENTHVRHVDLASNGLNEFGATQIAQVRFLYSIHARCTGWWSSWCKN